MAVLEDSADELRRALKAAPVGAVNAPRYEEMHGQPPLWFAVQNGQPAMARQLIEAGASLAYKERDVTLPDGEVHKGRSVFDLLKKETDVEGDDPLAVEPELREELLALLEKACLGEKACSSNFFAFTGAAGGKEVGDGNKGKEL